MGRIFNLMQNILHNNVIITSDLVGDIYGRIRTND